MHCPLINRDQRLRQVAMDLDRALSTPEAGLIAWLAWRARYHAGNRHISFTHGQRLAPFDQPQEFAEVVPEFSDIGCSHAEDLSHGAGEVNVGEKKQTQRTSRSHHGSIILHRRDRIPGAQSAGRVDQGNQGRLSGPDPVGEP
jgi:hypothetical protein